MDEVFISYVRESRATAEAVSAAIRAAGHGVWMDDRIPAHREYADVISEHIDAASAVLVIWSDAATRSQWVRSEANRGRELGKLVQLRIDDARLPMPFDQIQCVDLIGWSGSCKDAGWQQVLAGISALSGTGCSASALDGAEPVDWQASVAVLPFRDLSPSHDQDYFCDGIAEEILMSLARLPGLRVASPAVLGDTTAASSGRAIAREIGVTTLLEGSVRKASNRARIAVRLVQAETGFALWAETFDRDLADIFALQDEIARAVVQSLGMKLLPSDAAGLGLGGSENSAAYDLYLRAKALVRCELEAERIHAAELYRESIRLDPGFALAHAGLAEVLSEIARLHLADWSDTVSEALGAADRAVQIEPKLAEAHMARGAALRLTHDPGAHREFELAAELSPHDPNVHYRYARFLVLEGKKREAIQHYERSFALAPDDYRPITFSLQEYQALGDADGEKHALERSRLAVERHLRLNPDDVRAIGHAAGLMALSGRCDECDRMIERALPLRPDDCNNLGTLACAAMLNNDPDRALDLLEKVAASGRGDKEWLVQDNDLKPLHGHPRFEALVARMA